MRKDNAEKTILYKTMKGHTISLSPQEYAEIEDKIEGPGKRLLLKEDPAPFSAQDK